MSAKSALIAAIKLTMKARGMRYADLARAIGISEASVKRCMSQQTLTLDRIERICDILETDLFELARLGRRTEEERRFLSLEQERALAGNAQLLNLFHLAASGWTFAEILAEFEIDRRALSRDLARLDQLGLLVFSRNERMRLRVPSRFEWRINGPVRRLHGRAAMAEFLAADFAGREDWLRLDVRELSDTSLAQLRRKLERIAQEFQQSAEMDAGLPTSRRRSIGMVLALRPWVFSLIGTLPQRRRAPGP